MKKKTQIVLIFLFYYVTTYDILCLPPWLKYSSTVSVKRGLKKMREDRTALNQIFSFVVMHMWGLFEILIEVDWFTLSNVLPLPSLRGSG